VVFLMVGGLLVWVRGIHAPSSASPYSHFSRPMLFCYCYSFLVCVMLLALQPALIDFRSKLDYNSCF
jgi:hypothetical protein